jgi:hypothetical protein
MDKLLLYACQPYCIPPEINSHKFTGLSCKEMAVSLQVTLQYHIIGFADTEN